MNRLATSALAAAALLAVAAPVRAEEGAPMAMAGGLSIMPDGNDMNWQPAPAILPKGMMITMLAGDPAKPGPFTIRLTMPANTVIAPHTHSKDENVTVISGDFYHGHDKTIDKSKGTECTPAASCSCRPSTCTRSGRERAGSDPGHRHGSVRRAVRQSGRRPEQGPQLRRSRRLGPRRRIV